MSSMLLCVLADEGRGAGAGRALRLDPMLEKSEGLGVNGGGGGGSSCRRWHVRENARMDCWWGRMGRDESCEVAFASRRVVEGVIFEALTVVRRRVEYS